jgi:hypothetical protein
MRSRYFWLGVGLAGAAWLWRRQLRPLAVKGAKGGLLVAEGIKDNVKAVKDIFIDLKQDAQTETIRQEVPDGKRTTETKEEQVEDL